MIPHLRGKQAVYIVSGGEKDTRNGGDGFAGIGRLAGKFSQEEGFFLFFVCRCFFRANLFINPLFLK